MLYLYREVVREWLASHRFCFRGTVTCLTAMSLLLFQAVHLSAREVTESQANLETLDGLVKRWMELRTSIADEEREWKEHREQWEQEIELLELESGTLQKEIDEGGVSTSSIEEKRAEAMAQKEKMERELENLRAVLDRAESNLRPWRNQIPPSLMAPLAEEFDALPASQEQANRLPITKRARTVARLFTQIETLQNQFHVTRETVEIKGVRRRVDVLYAGLARAFAVSPDNEWAAIGTPGEAGWSWSTVPDEAEAFRHAMDVMQHQVTAQWVPLPMQVAGEVTP